METSCKNLVKENQDWQADSQVSHHAVLLHESFTTHEYEDTEPLQMLAMPDSIFLHIFSFLPFSSIGCVAQVCRRWHDISKDELLWKEAFLRHYRLSPDTKMPAKALSWRCEFERLHYHSPCLLSEERKEHRDEVLHISFSHDGTMFATCSKDGFFKVWECGHPCRLLFEKDMMSSFSWKFTQFSQFNETDSCLLVSGVYFGSLSTSGEIAVFNLQDDFTMQCRVTNKPYDVFGAWYDNDHLLSGTLYWTGDFNSVSAVWLSKASQEVESEMESVSMVLYRFENHNSSSIRLLHVAEVERSDGEGKDRCCMEHSPSPVFQADDKSIASLARDNLPCMELSSRSAVRSDLGKFKLKDTIGGESLLDKLLRRNIAENDFDVENEDETEEEEDEEWGEENKECDVSSAFLLGSDNFNESNSFNCDNGGGISRLESVSSARVSDSDSFCGVNYSDIEKMEEDYNPSTPSHKQPGHEHKLSALKDINDSCLPCHSRNELEALWEMYQDHEMADPERFAVKKTNCPSFQNGRGFNASAWQRDANSLECASTSLLANNNHLMEGREMDVPYGGAITRNQHESTSHLARSDDCNNHSSFGNFREAGINPISEGQGRYDNVRHAHSCACDDVEKNEERQDHHWDGVDLSVSVSSCIESEQQPVQKCPASFQALSHCNDDDECDTPKLCDRSRMEDGVNNETCTEVSLKKPESNHNSSSRDLCMETPCSSVVDNNVNYNVTPTEVPPVPSRQMDNASTQTEEGESLAGLFYSAAPTATSQSASQSMSHSSSLSREVVKGSTEKLLIYTWGSETYIPHKIGIKRIKRSDFCKGEVKARHSSMLLPDVMENLHNMAEDRRDTPDVSINMHGHIVGLSLSPDQRYLYVNCRAWPKNYIISDPQESPPLAQEVEIFSIDLTTFQFVGPVLRSHKAYTHSDECFFLNLDVSEDYVVSGAEDRKGYIWDRHYGICLGQFDHRSVVNCMAVCPTDPEVAVSVSDDHTFKVWMSRRKMREAEKRGQSASRRLTHQSSPAGSFEFD